MLVWFDGCLDCWVYAFVGGWLCGEWVVSLVVIWMDASMGRCMDGCLVDGYMDGCGGGSWLDGCGNNGLTTEWMDGVGISLKY
jgi:hypothetical protein